MVYIQALGFIFKSLGIKSVPYLPQVSSSLTLVIYVHSYLPPPPPPPPPLGDATISACYLQLQSRHAGVHVQTAGPDRLHHQTTCTRLHAGHLLRHQGEEGGREGGVGDVRGSAAIVTSSLLRKHTVPEAICCCSNKVCHVIRIRTKFHLHAR